jgi:DNA polymerase III sliding clamp (beta) subunit (PCNA family)
MKYNKNNLSVVKLTSTSKQKFKPELCSVLFTENKTVATNSFELIEISTPKNDEKVKPFKFMVQGDIVKCLPNMYELDATYSKEKHTVEFSTANALFENKITVNEQEGEYPDYKTIIPDDKKIQSKVVLNAFYIQDVISILKNVSGKNGRITIKFFGEGKPVLFEAHNDKQEGRALIMPMVND